MVIDEKCHLTPMDIGGFIVYAGTAQAQIPLNSILHPLTKLCE